MGVPWATIGVGTRFHHRACGITGSWRWIDPIQGLFFRRVLADPSLTRFGTIDPYLQDAARHPKVVYCPDPCPLPALTEQARARDAYGLRLGAFVVVVFGVIDRRKCLNVLLDGAARVPTDIDLTVLVAGPHAKNDLAATMRSASVAALRGAGRLVEIDRFILSGQDVDPVSAADVVWVFYEPNFVYSSSVLVRAARSGRPVVVRRRGVVGKQVEENGLGLALESDSPESVASALTRLARDASMRRRMGEAGTRTFANHSPQAFARPITDAVVGVLDSGRPADLVSDNIRSSSCRPSLWP
jgi:glycosyltransferase involved in cell wall biosynthesis